MALPSLKKVEAFVVKAAAVAATVAGVVTAAVHGLPGVEAGVLTAVGPAIYVAERYLGKFEAWAKKTL